MIMPDIMSPTIPGTLNFLNTIGAKSIMVISIVKTITGSLNGRFGKLIRNMPGLFYASANVTQLTQCRNFTCGNSAIPIVGFFKHNY
jgi:hypothetical protein